MDRDELDPPDRSDDPAGQALETAMRLFWRHGYEGVDQRSDEAIGIAPPRLYAACRRMSTVTRPVTSAA